MLPVRVESGRPLVTRPVMSAGSRDVSGGLIEIELESSRIRIRGSVDAQALRTVLETLIQR